MTKEIDFYFDVGSPTAYLAYKQLLKLAEQYGARINYKAMLLGGVFKATQNSSPILVPSKGQYMVAVDLPRFMKRYDVALNFNPNFPINTLSLMRGFYAAREMGIANEYLQQAFDGMWLKEMNFNDSEALQKLVENIGADLTRFNQLLTSTDIKDQLKTTTEEAVTRGVFGAPTMFIGDEMFFGQDRLDFIEEYLDH